MPPAEAPITTISLAAIANRLSRMPDQLLALYHYRDRATYHQPCIRAVPKQAPWPQFRSLSISAVPLAKSISGR